MAIEKVIRNTDEACKILKELVNTPQCYDVHFEFDLSVDSVPQVMYTVKRFVYVEEKDGRDNA